MFWRKKKRDSMEVADLLANARASSDPGPSDAGAVDVESRRHFSMVVDDVFTIKGRGHVLTGQIRSGIVRVGMTLTLTRHDEPLCAITVAGVEKFRSIHEEAGAGEAVGLLVRDISQDVVAGDVLTS